LIPYNSVCKESEYLFEMAKMHKLSPKLDVIRRLRHEMDQLQTESEYAPDIKGEPRDWLILHLSAQIFALALELTEDLAAVCKSYMDTIEKKDTRVIERIAKFDLGEADKFYKRAASDAQYAAAALGLGAPDDDARKTFQQIREARTKWRAWYIGYKHQQFATPVTLSGTDSKGNSVKKWGLYLIPKNPDKPQPDQIHTGDRFIDTVTYVDVFIKIAETCVQLWSQTVGAQLPRVFNEP
jgi:hypothetical protein